VHATSERSIDTEKEKVGQKCAVSDNMTMRLQSSELSNLPCLSSTSSSNSEVELLPGHLASDSIGPGRMSRIYTTSAISIQFETLTDLDPTSSNVTSTRVTYTVQMLSTEELSEMKKCKTILIVDAEALQGEILYELDALNSFYIAARGLIVRITVVSAVTHS